MNIPSPVQIERAQHRPVAAAVLLMLLGMGSMAHATATATAAIGSDGQAVEFNEAFISPGVDAARFAQGNPLDAGSYSVDIYVNERMLQRAEMRVVLEGGRKSILLPASVLRAARVKESYLAAAVQGTPVKEDEPAAGTNGAPVADDTLVPVAQLGPSAGASFDANEYRLNVSLPQIMLSAQPRGYVDPSLWNAGSSGLLLNYVANAYHSQAAGSASDSAYLGLRAGFNVGLWQYRNVSSLSWSDGQGANFHSSANYIQRALPGMSSMLRLGDGYSSSKFSSSMPMRGVVLASDDRMLPDSQRGYAPVVRGVARTNARVTVRQQGSILYQTTVGAGPFEITDLYPTGYGGDLQVTVVEADGSQQNYSVPYAALPELLRPDHWTYEVAAGKLKDDYLRDAPAFGEVVYQRGLSNSLTATVGVQVGEKDYASTMGGVAFNTPIGAVSTDATLSRARIGDDNRAGWSWRTAYSKYLPDSGTNFSLAAYRYSSSGFASLRDAAYLRQSAEGGKQVPLDLNSSINQRRSFQIYASQQLGSGNVYASGSISDYWDRPEKVSTYQVGYSNVIGSASYSVGISRTYDTLRGGPTTELHVGLSIPLGSSAGAPQLSTSLTRSQRGDTSVQTNISGATLEDRSLAYSAFASGNRIGEDSSGSVGGSLSKTTGAGTLQGSASYGGGYSQASVGMTGSLLAHGGGVTFGQYTGDTVGLIEAKGAEGASVGSRTNVKVDSNGYAIVPSLAPYRDNEITLDPKGASDDVELLETSQRVAPYAGAVVKLPFETSTGTPSLLVLQSGPSRVPLGAIARDAEGRELGVVGGEGRLLVRNLPSSGRMGLRWGSHDEQGCSFDLASIGQARSKADETGGIAVHAVNCLPQAPGRMAEPQRPAVAEPVATQKPEEDRDHG